MNPILLPVVAAQGLRVRVTTETLPRAAGPTVGIVGEGSRPAVYVAVVGETTAAGCGVDSHDDGFTGVLTRELAARTGQSVEWKVVGQDGATARHVRAG